MPSQVEKLRVERDGAVLVLTIDDPERRNALGDELLAGLAAELGAADEDPAVRCVLIAGSERVFASGADIRALAERSPSEAYLGERGRDWAAVRRTGVPVVAAVSGYCLGGGLELALCADVVIASESAVFGLPETSLGLLPGAGGTQHLTRTVGRAVAMDMVLSGRRLDAAEAERSGLVSRRTAQEEYLALAREVAAAIAARPRVAQRLARESVANAYEMGLEAGVQAERRAFSLALATTDAQEGMAAFIEKRDPDWGHR